MIDICRWLAHASGSRVVSVDYGLAPEHPYPTAVLQTAGVLSALLDENQGEERSVFIAGDSAGANIAAMAVLASDADRRKRIAGFISIYGAYSPHLNLSSHKLYGDGRFGLSEAQMRWFWNLYAPHVPPDERDQLSPLGADLKSFPPTLCIGAECDLLLDDTIAFYSSLTRAGADVSLSLWPGINHGALHFVEIVDSVTAAAGAIIRYIEERRQTSGEALPSTPVSLARMLQAQPPAPLASTVMADPDASLRDFAGGPFAPIDNAFLTSRLRLHGSVAHRLATEIVGGIHPPGALLPREEDASASYGVSRSAYREAIRTLAAKGLVAATPKVGTKVAARSGWRLLDPDVIAWHFEAGCTAPFVRSLFEMRKIVEPSAAALTATRRDEEALSRLADALARLARVTPHDRDWQGAILDFHHVILTASENEFLDRHVADGPGDDAVVAEPPGVAAGPPAGRRAGGGARQGVREHRLPECRRGAPRDGVPHRRRARRHDRRRRPGQASAFLPRRFRPGLKAAPLTPSAASRDTACRRHGRSRAGRRRRGGRGRDRRPRRRRACGCRPRGGARPRALRFWKQWPSGSPALKPAQSPARNTSSPASVTSVTSPAST